MGKDNGYKPIKDNVIHDNYDKRIIEIIPHKKAFIMITIKRQSR